MKRVKHLLRQIGRAYLNSCREFYGPMLEAGTPICF